MDQISDHMGGAITTGAALQTAVVSLFPPLIETALSVGITGRAMRDGRLACRTCNPRDYADDARQTVDDRPFGGGPGMVMTIEPLRRALRDAKAALPANAPAIYLTPQGERFNQRIAEELAGLTGFVLVAARYEGVDERFVEADVQRELSIGDYVLSGGELAALVVLDAVARLLPGALGNPESATAESHVDGLLDWPHYTRPTRPETESEQRVPEVLLSGDHGAIALWRRQQALVRTWQRRPELLLDRNLTAADRALLAERIGEHT